MFRSLFRTAMLAGAIAASMAPGLSKAGSVLGDDDRLGLAKALTP